MTDTKKPWRKPLVTMYFLREAKLQQKERTNRGTIILHNQKTRLMMLKEHISKIEFY